MKDLLALDRAICQHTFRGSQFIPSEAKQTKRLENVANGLKIECMEKTHRWNLNNKKHNKRGI